jgi:hypothetical protein
MRRNLYLASMWALLWVLLSLVACGSKPTTFSGPSGAVVLDTPVGTSDQATQAVALTQVQDNANNQAVATAEIERSNSQATLSSANATLMAVQTQDQNAANIIAAQIAATAEFARANAQATLSAANSTQSAAQTQDAYQQTQVQEQQNRNEIAAGTQTAVANLIVTQTESAVVTAQWYTDQARQSEAQRQAPITFLLTWCLPVFIVLFAGLGLWGFWRWLKVKQANQQITAEPTKKLQAPVDAPNSRDRYLPPRKDIINGSYPPTKPDDQMRRWMDEIKRKLLKHEKDDDDNQGS